MGSRKQEQTRQVGSNRTILLLLALPITLAILLFSSIPSSIPSASGSSAYEAETSLVKPKVWIGNFDSLLASDARLFAGPTNAFDHHNDPFEYLATGIGYSFAQGFTTGDNKRGYLVNSIDTELISTSADAVVGALHVTILEADSQGRPAGSAAAVFESKQGTDIPTSRSPQTANFPLLDGSDNFLKANTKYFVVIWSDSPAEAGRMANANRNSTPDEGSEIGWTIEPGMWAKRVLGTNPPWVRHPGSAQVSIRIKGEERPDALAYEGYSSTPAGWEASIADANMLEFNVRLDKALGNKEQAYIRLTTEDGTAIKKQDYSHRILIERDPPDETHWFGRWESISGISMESGDKTKKVYVRVLDDDRTEGAETMKLKAQIITYNGDEPELAQSEFEGVILDKKVNTGVKVSIEDASAEEGSGTMEFRVSLNKAPTADLGVYYTTQTSTSHRAAIGKDYEKTQGWLTFLEGETSKTISVPILDDALDEYDNERFDLRLARAVNAEIDYDNAIAQGVIIDDEEEILTSTFKSVPQTHNGQNGFTFSVKFNYPVKTKYKAMRDRAFNIEGGTVTSAKRVNGRRDYWKIRVQPGTTSNITITLPETTNCNDGGAICSYSNAMLSNASSVVVRGPQTTVVQTTTPLTATFTGNPSSHNGDSFTFSLNFSENVRAGYRRVRDNIFTIDSDKATIQNAVRQARGSNQNWTITVKPKGTDNITITLPETTNCQDPEAVCSYGDNPKMLNNTTTLTIPYQASN